MKMYRKNDLTLIDGMLVCETTGDIVVPDIRIIEQANTLEDIKQKAEYLSAQPAATTAPSLDGFERKSIKDEGLDGAKFKATTPFMDMEAAKSIAIMDEIDDLATVEAANAMLGQFSELLAFVNNEYVVDCGGDKVIPFDTPTLGSVLELQQEDVTAVVALMSGLHCDEDCDETVQSEVKRISRDEMDDEDIEAILKIIAKHDEEAAKMMEEDSE